MINFLIDWAGLATSFYITISLLWLGIMVLIAGNRKSFGAWLTGIGLLLGFLFFTSHTAILGLGLATTGFGMDFWWWVSWIPAVVAPLSWYCVIFWYSGYRPGEARLHRFGFSISFLLAVIVISLFSLANPLPAYQNLVGRTMIATPTILGLPVLVFAYGFLCLLCFCLPIDLILKPISLRNGASRPMNAQMSTRARARPWLIATSAALFFSALLMVWTALWVLYSRPLPSLSNPADALVVKSFDLAVAACVGLAATFLGRTVVAYEVFTAKPLPRSTFFSHWRATVLFAASFSILIAWTIVIDLRSIYSLMLTVACMTCFYALFSWSSIRERDHMLENLQPFLTSQNLYRHVTRLAESQKGLDPLPAAQIAAEPADNFYTLCNVVLKASQAILMPSDSIAPLAGSPLRYPEGIGNDGFPSFSEIFNRLNVDSRLNVQVGFQEFEGQTYIIIPLKNEYQLYGIFLLGEKNNGDPYSEEEIRIARAGGERIIDSLAGTAISGLAMALLRQRIAQVKVLEGQGRRILHDDVLPAVHTAILLLSSESKGNPALEQIVDLLSSTHRSVADLIRSSPGGMQSKIDQIGLVKAIQSMLDDFSDEFTGSTFQIDPESMVLAKKIPLFVSEVIYYACRELVRNACDHARKTPQENLHLEIQVQSLQKSSEPALMISVRDDGKVTQPNPSLGFEEMRPIGKVLNGGAGAGLQFHSAMLAAVGARLEIVTKPGSGTTATILLPASKYVEMTNDLERSPGSQG